jgi:hypothetical protein
MTLFTLRSPALLLTAAAALPLLAADALSARTGLWETTTVTSSGGMSMPADALAKMPPAQRAQMEQMFKQMGAGGPNTTKTRSCVTAKDLQEGAFRQRPEAGSDCKYTPGSNTAKRQEWTFQCTGRNGTTNGRMVVDAVDSTHVRGTMEIKSPQMSMNMKFDSAWLGASCAGADKD